MEEMEATIKDSRTLKLWLGKVTNFMVIYTSK